MAEVNIPEPIKGGGNKKPLPIANTTKELNTFSKEVQKNTVKVKDSAFSLKLFIKETKNATKKISDFFSLSQVGVRGDDKSIGILEDIKNIMKQELEIVKRKALDEKEEDFRQQEDDVEEKRTKPGKNSSSDQEKSSYLKSLLDGNKTGGIFSSFGLADLYAMLFSPKLIIGALGLPKLMSMISNGLRTPLALMASAVGYKIYDAYEKSADVAASTNTSGLVGGLATFFGGNGADDLASQMNHYGGWIAMGAAAGLPFGPVGIIAGAVLGGALGALGKWIGTGRIADWVDNAGVQFNSLFDVFSGNKDVKEIDARLEKVKAQIQLSQENWKATNDQIIAKEEELRQARQSGNTERIAALAKELEGLYEKRNESVADTEAERLKYQALINEKEIRLKESVMGRLGLWLDQQAEIAYGQSFSGMFNEMDNNRSEFDKGVKEDVERIKKIIGGIWTSTIDTLQGIADSIKKWITEQFTLQTWIDRWNGKEAGDLVGSMVGPASIGAKSTKLSVPTPDEKKKWLHNIRKFFGNEELKPIQITPIGKQMDDLYVAPKMRAPQMIQTAVIEKKAKQEKEDRAERATANMAMQSIVNNKSSVINSTTHFSKTLPFNPGRQSPLSPTGY